MRIATLVENTSMDKKYRKKHGLCLYIETENHKVLFDLGPDDTFLHNAKTMGIEVKDIDTVVLSHGHVDHGGALPLFLKINSKAKVYMHEKAAEPHYVKLGPARLSVGIDTRAASDKRVIRTGSSLLIDDELFLFSDVDGGFESRSNRTLFAKSGDVYQQDAFDHEQSLIVKEQGKTVVFTGCSHRGIGNIVNAACKHVPAVDVAIGGFHLFSPAKITEPARVIEGVAAELKDSDTLFYTCHCTGRKAFGILKQSMQDKLEYLSAGMELEI